jgi:hypothetical protein
VSIGIAFCSSVQVVSQALQAPPPQYTETPGPNPPTASSAQGLDDHLPGLNFTHTMPSSYPSPSSPPTSGNASPSTSSNTAGFSGVRHREPALIGSKFDVDDR